jgi:hypothetical protein
VEQCTSTCRSQVELTLSPADCPCAVGPQKPLTRNRPLVLAKHPASQIILRFFVPEAIVKLRVNPPTIVDSDVQGRQHATVSFLDSLECSRPQPVGPRLPSRLQGACKAARQLPNCSADGAHSHGDQGRPEGELRASASSFSKRLSKERLDEENGDCKRAGGGSGWNA